MAKKIKRYATGGVVERYSNPLFVQGMQGGLSAFGQSSTSAVYGNGGKIKKSEPNYGQPPIKYSEIPFIHETGIEDAKSILTNGFKLPKDPIITKGVYTIPIVYKNEKFDHSNRTKELVVWLKEDSKIFWTNSERPTDYYLGYGNKFYEDLYEKLNFGHKTPRDDFHNKDYQKAFCRRMEKWLKDNGYSGVQQGGEVVITNLDAIDYIDSFERIESSPQDSLLKKGGEVGNKYYASIITHNQNVEPYINIKPQTIITNTKEEMVEKLNKLYKKTFSQNYSPYEITDLDEKYAINGTYISDDWSYVTNNYERFKEIHKIHIKDFNETSNKKQTYAKGGEVEITNSTIDRGGLGSVQDSILADGGLLKEKDFEIGDVVTHKKGRAYGHGRIYKKTAIGFYLEDKFGNKSDKQYLFIDGWKKAKKLMGNGGNVDPHKFTQDSLLKKGGGAKSRVQILDDTKKFDESMYEGLLGDFDLDGLANVDDPNPIGVKNNDSIEQVKFSNVFKDVLKVKEEKDDTLKKFVDTLKKTTTTKEKIYGRTKTPYSILNKLVDKRLLHAKYGLMDLIGTTISFSNFNDLERYKKKVENGKLGRVIEFDDYYRNPNDGYRAYHFIIEYDGSPIELQLKTDRMKEINILSHDAYKHKMLNKAYMLYLTTLGNEADNGDQRAMEEFASLMSRKDLVKKKLTLSSHK